MRFKRLKIAGLVALTLVLMVAIGACDSASPLGSGSNGGLTEEFEVTVLVVDDGGDQLEGVSVRLGELVRDTDNNGTAVFAGVDEGSYQLDVDYGGYNARDGDTGTVTVGEDLTDFTVEMAVDDSGDDSGDDGSGDSQDDGDTSGDDDSNIDDGDSSSDGDDSGDGDTGGDDGSSDGDTGGDDGSGDDGSDGSDPVAGEYNESGVLSSQFDSSENKVVDLGKLAAGETAIVAVSPLNIDPNNANTYDASLNVTYSDGTTASLTEVASLDSSDSQGGESSPQAELDAELRELENQLLAQDLKPVETEVTVQDTYQIGDSRSFYNRFNNQVNSRLVAIGEKVLIYLEDGYSLDNSTLEELVNSFDNNINSTLMDNFAFYNQAEYDWDGNGRTTILIEDMGGSLNGGMIMGYFYSRDYYDDSYISGNSNEADMFYINYQGVREAEVNSYFSLDSVLATIAHEYQHLIFFVNKMNSGRDPYSTDTWINEGFAMLAEYLAGYRDYRSDYRVNNYYFPYPGQTSVMAWEQSPSDYGASSLIAYYLYEKLGSRIIEDIQTSSQAASQVISGNYRDFSGLLLDWMLSNYLDGENVGDYSYSGFNLAEKPAVDARIDGSFSGNFSLKSTAVKYFEIEGSGAEVSLELENMNEDTGVIIYHDGEGS